MSDPFAEKLSRFTPDAGGLDRDALLFDAGRASARPNRRWVALAGVLAASQLLTLGLWWQQPPPATPVAPWTVEAPGPAAQPPAPAEGASGLLALRRRAVETEGNLPSPAPAERLAPSGPPLRAFAAPSPALLN
jgi:hypothetical protein